MDFLLECIGFPPDHDLDRLVELVRSQGERAPWRGPDGDHFRLPLGGGLELRADRDRAGAPWSVNPYFKSGLSLRLAVETVQQLPDSRYDALVSGWANPPVGTDASASREAYPIAALLTDARRIPRDLVRGHVLAIELAGFALCVDALGSDSALLESGPSPRPFADGGWISPLGAAEDPGGCVELAARIERVDALRNSLTGAEVTALELAAPGRPLTVFTSPWQLEGQGLRAPRAGDIVRGAFLLTGRISGGLRSATEKLGPSFG